MIEIPAAALTLKVFLKYFDFLSIGTNDLIQYTLAIDRADESVAHLYDPLHPAVLRLVADTIRRMQRPGQGRQRVRRNGRRHRLTRLLLGLGLRSFSMHPAQILAVKQEVLRADTSRLRRLGPPGAGGRRAGCPAQRNVSLRRAGPDGHGGVARLQRGIGVSGSGVGDVRGDMRHACGDQ